MVIIPETYRECLEIIDRNAAVLLAGGTDLMVKNRSWSGLPPEFDKEVVSLFRLKELQFIKKRKTDCISGR